MENRKIKIVVDSSADLLTLDGIDFGVAPLKITTSELDYVDNDALDVEKMTDDLSSYNGKSHTSCPSPADWAEAFGDANEIYCITITATLSGSYNSAVIAARDHKEKYEGSRVFVINSLSAGPELMLMAEKIRDLVNEGKSYNEIVSEMDKYTKKTGLVFMLQSMKNLANNGRVKPIVAKAAGLLGIRIVGKASDKGDLQPLHKCRGEEKSISTIKEELIKLGYAGGKLRIGHCRNERSANNLKAAILDSFPSADVGIYRSRGLCSFYAELGGLMIGFEG